MQKHFVPLVVAGVGLLITAHSYASADSSPTPGEIQSAISRSLPAFARTLSEYPKKVKCFSCHHQGVPAFALSLAKARGYAVDDDLNAIMALTRADLRQDLPMYVQGDGQPGGVTRAGYALLAVNSCGDKRDDVTLAVTDWMLKRDVDLGYWRARSNRPPAEFSNFTDTCLALLALKSYGDDGKKDVISARLLKARTWLQQAPTKETEDRVFRLWGLKTAGADGDALHAAAKELMDAQLPDGGWRQLSSGESDSYATGTVLTILRITGQITEHDPVFLRGIGYLLKCQSADGTWHVSTRSHPVQPYFESGFPYGKDQFISTAATAWAIAALAEAGAAADAR